MRCMTFPPRLIDRLSTAGPACLSAPAPEVKTTFPFDLSLPSWAVFGDQPFEWHSLNALTWPPHNAPRAPA